MPKLASLYPKPSACEGCPIQHTSLGFANPNGNTEDPKYIVVLQGARRNEIHYHQGLYFNAWPGNTLLSWLREVDIDPDLCYFDNAIRCQKVKLLPNGEPKLNPKSKHPVTVEPTYKETMECAKRHLVPSLDKLLPNLPIATLIPVGAPAMRLFLGKTTTLKEIGSLQSFDWENWKQVVTAYGKRLKTLPQRES